MGSTSCTQTANSYEACGTTWSHALEVAHSTAMIRHAMNLVANAIQHVNRGQVHVITMDQPLFTIGKHTVELAGDAQ